MRYLRTAAVRRRAINASVALSTTLGVLLGLFAAGITPVRAGAPTSDTLKMTGFKVLTAEGGHKVAANAVVVTYEGPIAVPMAENLRTIWDEHGKRPGLEKLILRLNSSGGSSVHGLEVIGILEKIREQVALVTLVGEHDLCASMCIAIYIQGDTRIAASSSSWMFHGASLSPGGYPSLSATTRHFELFRDRNINSGFIDFLFEKNYVTAPGAYWMSGSELAVRANIITRLLPPWKPAAPDPIQRSGILNKI